MMIKYKSLQLNPVFVTTGGLLMLLLIASCVAQTYSPENCTCIGNQINPKMESTDCIYSSIPEQATLVSPKNTIGTATPTFVWSPVEDCTKYCLKVVGVTDPMFIKEVCYDAYEVLSDGICSAKPNLNLIDGKTYRWWINTSNCMGKGPWSNFMEFEYNPGKLQLTKPSPLSPMGLISTKQPTFKWTAVPGATEYILLVETIDGRTAVNTLFDAEKVTRDDLCSALSPVILPDEVYFWGIRACIDNICTPELVDQDKQYFENICAFKPRAVKNKAKMAEMARMINK